MVSVAGVTGGVLNVALVVGGLVIIMAVLGAIIYLALRWYRYSQFKCVVWELDGFGQVRQTYDSAGVFVDRKTRNKRFFMRKANVGLEPDNIPVIGDKTVYLVRSGLKNFRFVKPRIVSGSLSFNVGEEDVNWAVNAYEKQKRLFNINVLLQYMPFILLAFVSIIILIIFIYFFKNFGVLKEMSVHLEEAAKQIAQAKAGTVVIS